MRIIWEKQLWKFRLAIRILAVYLAVRIAVSGVLPYIIHENSNLREILSRLFPISFINVLVLAAAALLTSQIPVTKHMYNRAAAALFAIAMLIGSCYKEAGTFFASFRGIGILLMPVYTYGFFVIFGMLFSKLEKIWQKVKTISCPRLDCILEKNLYWKAFIGMAVCWLPYIFIRYPAALEYDAYYQIEQGLGIITLNSHNPVLSSVLMGKIVELGGLLFHSYDAGIFMFVLFQASMSIAILAYSIQTLYKLGANGVGVLCTFILYAIIPIYPNFFTAIVKDSLFSAFVLLDIILCAQIIYGGGHNIQGYRRGRYVSRGLYAEE